MNDELERWLNEGLKESVEAAAHEQEPLPEPTAAAPQTNGEVHKVVSLSKQGIGRGGVIRNPNTKRRTQLNNPVADPRPAKSPNRPANAPTPESDAHAELIGKAPALAVPSIMTGMDVNTEKPVEQPTEIVHQVKEDPNKSEPVPISYDMTLREVLQRTIKAGGTMQWGNSRWVISVQVTALFGVVR